MNPIPNSITVNTGEQGGVSFYNGKVFATSSFSNNNSFVFFI